ncbi:hypothetical protein E1293_43105 [Actinomadura darangshiensis]|uniref:Uncharacterized protein n=2 Tax=Actinomadura darangshiensis TaxID=705336 RepID=A0A4R4ZYT3_9ACTN|nr:hypothetical protein E1293_43105 [Actinomadura darangshiensis]
MVKVTLDADADPLPTLTLQSETWELHIRATLANLSRLNGIREASWEERKSLQIGNCAGSPVFWTIAPDDQATLLIGQDDETWDIGLLIPLTTIDKIVTLSH